jgi:hypothetical protein
MSAWDHASQDAIDEARDAYDTTDPKHPDYPDAVTDAAERERKRRKEEGPMEIATTPEADELVLFTGTKQERMQQMVETAQVLAEPIRQRHVVEISGRGHVRVEGWTMLGALLGVYPYTVWTRRIEDGWEARVEARTRDGSVVGAAEAECLASEANWRDRDDYALRSMAQTRATSKALRQPLGFVITLAGFDATPAEEIPEGEFRAPALREDDYLSEGQRKKIYALRAKLIKADAFDAEIFDRQLADDYGATITGLTRTQASELIDRLEKTEARLER